MFNLWGKIQLFVNDQTKKGFIKFFNGCVKNPELFEIVDFFFPKHLFIDHNEYNLIILYINTISMLIRNKIEFTIEINDYVYIYKPFNEIQYGRIQLTLCLNNRNSILMTDNPLHNLRFPRRYNRCYRQDNTKQFIADIHYRYERRTAVYFCYDGDSCNHFFLFLQD